MQLLNYRQSDPYYYFARVWRISGDVLLESAIAKVAEALTIPYEETQTKNLLQAGDILPYGQELATNNLRLSWQEAEISYNLAEIRNRLPNSMPAPLRRKRAMQSCLLSFPDLHQRNVRYLPYDS